MSSSWGKKFEKKLTALADSASKESIQTLANWVGFNRKHAPIIAQTLTNGLKEHANNESRQWLYWQVVHELLLLETSNPAKWDKLQDLRTALGETTIVSGIETIPNVSPQVHDSLIKEWDDHNVFGGPTTVAQIRRLLTTSREEPAKAKQSTPEESKAAVEEEPAEPSKAEEAAEEEEEPAKSSTEANPDSKEIEEEEEEEENEEENEEEEESTPFPRRSSLSSLSGKDIEYDFESKVRYMWGFDLLLLLVPYSHPRIVRQFLECPSRQGRF
jgi:hypothetical protein